MRNDVERPIGQTAKPHDAQTWYRRQSVPGLGKMWRWVLLDDIQDMRRFPRVQACVSYGRLVTCAQAAAGIRSGTSGAQSGHASLPWAFSAAAVLCLRNHPASQKELARRAKRPGKGTA